MPWTVKDVDKHKKGLNSAQKKKWVEIANNALKNCQSKGGSNCEGSAIRIANSRFSEDGSVFETREVPMGALRFVATESHAHVEFAKEGDDAPPKLAMTAYSGKIIKNHWWWGDLAIDVKGGQFDKSKYPILESHDTGKKIAFTAKPIVTSDFKVVIDPAKTTFVDTEESREFQNLSKDGFPYESSMYVTPLSVERVSEGASADVNGFKLKGPGTVFRKWRFNEASVCVFGWDRQTQSAAFSKEPVEIAYTEVLLGSDEVTININDKKGEEVNTVDEIKTVSQLEQKFPDLVKQIRDAVTTELEGKFSTEREGLEAKIAEKEVVISGQSERILKLEKNDTIRTERELTSQARSIWTDKLVESDIPEHLYEKVRGMVSHSKFVKDDVLDVEKFSAAIDAEIKDWVDKGIKTSVLGTGFSVKSPTGENAAEAEAIKKENAGIVSTMLSHVGQPPKKDTQPGA